MTWSWSALALKLMAIMATTKRIALILFISIRYLVNKIDFSAAKVQQFLK
jgi:hypothetical protein